jgi:hypothetical protein
MIHNNTIYSFLLLLLLASCQQRNKETQLHPQKVTDEVVHKQEEQTPVAAPEKEEEPEVFVFNTLLASTYRIWDKNDPTQLLNNAWFDLFEKDGKYSLEKVSYDLTKGFDECSGSNTKTIETHRKTVLLVDDPKLSIGEVAFLPVVKKHIWPKQQQVFTFNNQTYTLRGEGTIEGAPNTTNQPDDQALWGKVKDYKLYMTITGSSEELILSQDSFNDTFVELLFVGDIDRDGKLDFIFGANRDYEEERVLLFLSSESESGQNLKKVSEVSIQSDC